LLAKFCKWVALLPASQDNHHSDDWGLLSHSMTVAQYFLWRLLHRRENDRLVEELPTGERRGWILGGLAAALLHDCGKLLDMEVRSHPSGRVWDPLKESVTAFIASNARRSEDETQYRFLPGRGLSGHEAKGRALVPVILPSSFQSDLTEKTLAVYDACVSHHELKDPKANWPAPWLAAVIITADREDSEADLKCRREANPPPSPQAN
jgi:hypothetical protein